MIYTVGSSRNNFLPLDGFRTKFIVDRPHDGDNIDRLNGHYCELTGMYYLWKHDNEDLCGLEHYRRYFYSGNRLLGREEAGNILSTDDIILVPHHHPRNRTTYDWFCGAGKNLDFDKWLMLLNRACPDFFEVMWDYCRQNLVYICNMFVTRREILDDYCSWLFPLLAKYDAVVGLTQANHRIDGYLAEHTLGAWCRWKGLRIHGGHMHMP